MTLAEVKKALRLAEERHQMETRRIAERVRKSVIKPYCKTGGLYFRAGNGAWAFFRRGYLYDPPINRAPRFKDISDILNEPVGSHNNLGSICDDVGERNEF